MPSLQNRNNVLTQFRNWVIGGWGTLFGVLITIAFSVFGIGYWCGDHFAKADAEIKIMHININHQRELFDEREKIKIQEAQDIKEKNEEFENVVKRVREEIKIGRR